MNKFFTITYSVIFYMLIFLLTFRLTKLKLAFLMLLNEQMLLDSMIMGQLRILNYINDGNFILEINSTLVIPFPYKYRIWRLTISMFLISFKIEALWLFSSVIEEWYISQTQCNCIAGGGDITYAFSITAICHCLL